jgi:hypothetical protein
MTELTSTIVWTCRCIISVVILFVLSIGSILYFCMNLDLKLSRIEKIVSSLNLK